MHRQEKTPTGSQPTSLPFARDPVTVSRLNGFEVTIPRSNLMHNNNSLQISYGSVGDVLGRNGAKPSAWCTLVQLHIVTLLQLTYNYNSFWQKDQAKSFKKGE